MGYRGFVHPVGGEGLHEGGIFLPAASFILLENFPFLGHNVSHMMIVPIEKVFTKTKESLKHRESEWIKEFCTLVPRGMNIKP